MTRIISGVYVNGVKLSGAGNNPATITSTGLLEGGLYASTGTVWNITNQGSVAGYGIALYSTGMVVNSGTITETKAFNFISSGVGFEVGGSVTNKVVALITGHEGVYGFGGAVTVVNAGVILGADQGIDLLAGGQVNNQFGGVIRGQTDGIFTPAAFIGGVSPISLPLSVVNDGKIIGIGTGVYAGGGGQITNLSAGYIYGNTGIHGYDGVTIVNAGKISGAADAIVTIGTAAATVVNAGVVAGNETTGTGVQLTSGSVTNQSGGTISGYYGIVELSAATIFNAGLITGNSTAGTGIFAHGIVTNQSSGTISGEIGVKDPGGVVTLTNAGTISGGDFAVLFSDNEPASRLIIDPGAVFVGTVSGGLALSPNATLELASAASGGTLTGLGTQFVRFAAIDVDAGASWTLTGANEVSAGTTVFNDGVLSGPVKLASGAVLSNASSGTISGYQAVYGISGSTVTIVNAGAIAGNATATYGAGVRLDGGSVTNQSGGLISGFDGIYQSGELTCTVVNDGEIIGSQYFGRNGISIEDGTIINQSLGTIGGFNGVFGGIESNHATLLNAGVITGGVQFYGIVTNQSSGTISGLVGVFGRLTLTNAGTISGTNGAVSFLTSSSRLIIDPGAVFVGGVSGGNGALELASGATAGTLSGLGTQFVHFASIAVDTGATWKLSATNTVPDGVTLTDAGTLANAGTLSSSVTLAAGAVLSNASSGTISGSSGTAVYGVASGASTVVNAGVIAGNTAVGAGVALDGGGRVTNQGSGTISGWTGIIDLGASAYIANAGLVAGSTTTASGNGIALNGPGIVTNQSSGTISGWTGIYDAGGSAAIANAGVITGSTATPSGVGIALRGPGSITNQSGGTIAGYVGIYGAASVVNAGSIAGDATAPSGLQLDVGVRFGDLPGGSVTNQIGGSISGFFGISSPDLSVTVVNDGQITGSKLSRASTFFPFGVGLSVLGSVTNQSSGVISGFDGVDATGPLTFTNAGTISGSQYAVNFNAAPASRLIIDPGAVFVGTVKGAAVGVGGVATILDLASAATAGTLSGLGVRYVDFAQVVVDVGASWTLSGTNSVSAGAGLTDGGTLINDGALTGPVTLVPGAVLSNASSGTIGGLGGEAVYGLPGADPIIVNAGIIAGNATVSAGVVLGGGSVTNQSGGTISGLAGIFDGGGDLTLLNAGVVEGDLTTSSGQGIQLASGSITNQSGGLISGYDGILGFAVRTVTVVNAGEIAGNATGGAGIRLDIGGSVDNQSGGTISGHDGIFGGSIFGLTVTTAGAISGGQYAVRFEGNTADRLIVDPGATFAGTVTGGSLTNAGTLELASAATAGTLSGLGTQFIDFASIDVDTGAAWTLSAPNTVAAGVTLTDAGTLTNAGTLNSPVTLAAGAVLSNASSGTITTAGLAAVYGLAGGPATVVNAGIIANANFTAGQGVLLAWGGVVSNQSGGSISGFVGIEGAALGEGIVPLTVVNDGHISGNAFHPESANAPTGIGVLLAGTAVNQSGGVISGYDGVDAAGSLTLTNAGLISGGRYAVRFGSDPASRLIVDPGAMFVGTVSGGNYAATLELAAAAAGTLSGLGTQFVGFARIDVDGGASWTLTGTNTVGTGTRLTDNGTLTNDGALSGTSGEAIYGLAGADPTVVNAGVIAGNATVSAGVLLGGGSVTNQSGGTISGLAGVSDGGPVTVVNDGAIRGAVNTSAGQGIRIASGSVTNQSGGSINGYYGILGFSASTVTVVNAGEIAGNAAGGAGIRLDIGGSVTNQMGGTISGFDGIVGGSILGLTITTAGAISGGQYAVRFEDNTADRLIADPGATFAGTVSGGSLTNAGTLELASAATAGTLSGLGTQFVDFASIHIDAGASWTLTGTNSVSAAATLSNAGTLTLFDATLTADNLVNNGEIVVDPSTMTVADLTGNGAVTIAAGSTLEVQGAVSGGETIVFGGTGAYLRIDAPDSFAGSIVAFANGDSIDLVGVAPATVSYADGALAYGSNGGSIALAVSPGTTLATSGDGGSTEIGTLCFCANTRILTPDGERAVQDLAVGDLVTTHDGGRRPITWIGTGAVLATRSRRTAATPVIVRRGALADNVPVRDLHVTKGHGIYIDNVLIPAEFLVNHRNIVWDDRALEVELYHIELDAHDVMVADGAPAESYRDDGNRWLFRNANTGWDLPPLEPFAPVLTGGPIVDAVWRRLLDRAGPRALPPLTDEPDLHLRVDGKRVDCKSRSRGAYQFDLPPHAMEVRVVSRAGVPAELGWARDPRLLGVAIRRIMLWQDGRTRTMDIADPALTDGFCPFEPDNKFRWTDGDARLPQAWFVDGAQEMGLHVTTLTQYPDFGVPVAAVA